MQDQIHNPLALSLEKLEAVQPFGATAQGVSVKGMSASAPSMTISDGLCYFVSDNS
jgi:hypothetical protein